MPFKRLLKCLTLMCLVFASTLVMAACGANPYGLNGVWGHINGTPRIGIAHNDLGFAREIEFSGNTIILRKPMTGGRTSEQVGTFIIDGDRYDGRMEIIWSIGGHNETVHQTVDIRVSRLAPNELIIGGARFEFGERWFD